MFKQAMVLHQQGQVEAAAAVYRQVLASMPRHADALHLLGLITHQQGNAGQAVDLLTRAVSANAEIARYHCSLANALRDAGRMGDAITAYRRALTLDPRDGESLNNLGGTLSLAGRADAAAEYYGRLVALYPDVPDAHLNLAGARLSQGDLVAAAALLERACALDVTRADAKDLLVRVREEIRQAEYAWNEVSCALTMSAGAADVEDGLEARRAFVACMFSQRWADASMPLRARMAQAIADPWASPIDLGSACQRFLRQNAAVRRCVEVADAAWPAPLAAEALFEDRLPALAADPLLRALLENVQCCDLALEKFFTLARRALLQRAVRADSVLNDDEAALLASLAAQCFINEYVWCVEPDERQSVDRLAADFVAPCEADASAVRDRLLAIAAYRPLASLGVADDFAGAAWSPILQSLVDQQIVEPAREARLRTTLPALTEISAGVSGAVRAQYEEHPYPRWTRLPPADAPVSLKDYLAAHFPHAGVALRDENGAPEILVAGCGTGLQAIGAARQFAGARVLAVDLSLASLAYAKRKSAEFGLANISYAQADILQIEGIGRSFDEIEAMGVLHHLQDPLEGWRKLLRLLRPGGVMRIGLYSEIARRAVVAARERIATRGYGADAEGMRRFRKDLMLGADDETLAALLRFADFFSLSECRDLLFHVQEHRFTIPQLAASLASLGLRFIGFILDPATATAYRQQFPDDVAMTDLANWERFEEAHPDVFAGMYRFYVQCAEA